MLRIHHCLPDGLLERDAAGLFDLLGGPTLLYLDGAVEPALFVSVLLHGNEPAGWEALRAVLARHPHGALPRSLVVFIGNVAAALKGVRRLEGQPDFNRIWRGGDTPYHALAGEVLAKVRERGIVAAVDVHNTTGRNPHYAVVTKRDDASLTLASRFARRIVHSTRPDTVLAAAFAPLAPAVTVECGQPGHAYGSEHAEQFLESCLAAASFAGEPGVAAHVELYAAVARVKVPEQVAFGFAGVAGLARGAIAFVPDLDTLNFHEIPAGTTFARVAPESDASLEAWSNDGSEVAGRYFARRGDAVVNAVPVIPSMLTLDERAVRQDCLCYLMERVNGT